MNETSSIKTYNPFKFLNNSFKVQAFKRQASYQKGVNTKLQKRVQSLEAFVNTSLSLDTITATGYKGNEYDSYDTAVSAIAEKYEGTADWGVLQTGNIIDLRAAFIIGEGIKVVKRKGKGNAKREIEWANEFLKFNNLEDEVAQDYAIEAEIEGKIALKLAPKKITTKDKDGKDKEDWQIAVRFISWIDKHYTVKTDPNDYLDYQELKWTPTEATKEETIKAPNFVYKKFGGRISEPNTAAPKVMKCLTQIDDLSKALRDWREIDRIYAGPILGVECKTPEDVATSRDALSPKNFKIKKAFVSTAKIYYAQLDISGITAIENEIITLAKMISGTTGVPVHFLGFTDILKQVATAKNLMESVKASTSKERITWKGAYEEVITKAMELYNKKMFDGLSDSKKLDPSKIGVEIPFLTEEQWERLINFWLPASIAGKISDEAMREQVPGLDLEAEEKRMGDKDKKILDSLLDNKEDEDENEENEENEEDIIEENE